MPRNERFVIGKQRSDVSAFADRFERWCGEHAVPMETMTAFQIAFDEMLTNALDYGLAGRDDAELEVRLTLEADGLAAELVDNGIAFDPLADTEQPDIELGLEKRDVGGLGVHLVRNLMDQVRYQRVEPHNHFFMSKRFTPQRG